MLTDKEKQNLRGILKLVPDSDLRLLAQAVTQRVLIPENSEEAMDAILLHSPTVESLLSRQKVTKDILFKYLNKKGVSTFGRCDKISLTVKIIEFWNEGSKNQVQVQQQPTVPSSSSDGQVHHKAEMTSGQANDIAELARQFTIWFFNMYNQQIPQLGVEHFWPDCSMCLTLSSGMVSERTEMKENAQEVANLLIKTKTDHNLYFNPNMTTEGVQGKVNVHGLVLVLVCGTLHQQDKCVGVFEQLFGLVRDPASFNNWKIKCIQLNLKSQENVSRLPTLHDGSLIYEKQLTELS